MFINHSSAMHATQVVEYPVNEALCAGISFDMKLLYSLCHDCTHRKNKTDAVLNQILSGYEGGVLTVTFKWGRGGKQ